MDTDTLEQIIDEQGIERVLDAINEICNMKAEHLRTNWQDNITAKAWERVAAKVAKAEILAQGL